jgi:hypothetical protein
MRVSRKLDELVAEKVMGLDKMHLQIYQSLGPNPKVPGTFLNVPYGTVTAFRDGIQFYTTQDVANLKELPHYSTDISAAWEVVEKFTPRIRIECCENTEYVDFNSNERWHVDIWDGRNEPYCVTAPTAPLAICKAALKAVGVTGEEIERVLKDE